MALTKFGGGIIQMSGSIAGNTFARNRYGNYVRARTKPINPKSSYQERARIAVSYLTERWHTALLVLQRQAWTDYALAVPFKNKLGESIYLTGFNHYIRSNSILQSLGFPIVDDGPTELSLPDKDNNFSISVSEGTQLMTCNFSQAMDWVNEDNAHMFVYMGLPQLLTRNFFNGPYRYDERIDGSDSAPKTSPQTWTVAFPVAEDQKVWAKARIARADGRLSEPFYSFCTCGV